MFHALFSIFWWGIWGFVVKLGSDKISPRQMQILFMVGMVPLVVATLIRLSFKVDFDGLGITYGVLNGVFTTLGLLAYYAAMQRAMLHSLALSPPSSACDRCARVRPAA